jgi:hypothetical protein
MYRMEKGSFLYPGLVPNSYLPGAGARAFCGTQTNRNPLFFFALPDFRKEGRRDPGGEHIFCIRWIILFFLEIIPTIFEKKFTSRRKGIRSFLIAAEVRERADVKAVPVINQSFASSKGWRNQRQVIQ